MRKHLLALALYTALAIVMTWPVAIRLQNNVAGIGGDPWQTMWRFEMKGQNIQTELTQDIFGTGSARLANLSVWPWMPIHLMLGQPLGYNVIFLLNFALTGYAMALFIKMLTRSKSILEPAPILSGIAYMFLPFHSAQALGHFGAMQLEWIPFIAAITLSYIRNQKIWKILVLGLLVTIQAWEEHHYILWIAIFGVIAGVVYLKELRGFVLSSRPVSRDPGASTWIPGQARNDSTKILSALLLAAILIFGIIVPYIPTIKLASTNTSALSLGIDQTIRFSADLFSFITPPPWHPIWGDISSGLFGQYFTGNQSESVQYIGVTILLALLFFHKHIPVKQKHLWITTAVVFAAISLGPVLHMFGRVTSLPLPYAALASLPVFSAIRVVARAGVFVGFASVVLFGWVIATNSHRKQTSYIIAAVLLLEFLCIPFPMQSAKLSPSYTALQHVAGVNLIEIPAATNYTTASRSLFATTIHHKEVLGNIALERGQDADAFALEKSIPAIRQLLYLRTTELNENRPEFFGQDLAETLPDAMAYLQVNGILLHSDSLSKNQNATLEKFLSPLPWLNKIHYSDATLYERNDDISVSSDGVFLVRGEGFENVGYDPKRKSTFAEIPKQASVDIINMNDQNVNVRLEYSLAPESQGELRAQNTITLTPGKNTVLFEHSGQGKSIIQNPILVVTPSL